MFAETECRLCRATLPDFEKAVAHGVYQGTLKALLHLLKYDGMESLGQRLGALLAGPVLAIPDLPGALLAVPVPLFGKKRKQRGFNQSELLARGLLGALRVRRPEMRVTLAGNALERQRATESQAGLSSHQRRANVRGAFFVLRPEAVKGQAVLLIDDIFTTGATARACATALKRAGAASVWVATVARAQKEMASAGHATEYAIGPGDGPVGDGREPAMEEDVAYWDEGPGAGPG